MPRMDEVGSAAFVSKAKLAFVNPARGFVKRALALPGLPMILAASAAAVVVATLAGAFGTAGLPIFQRFAFWTLLIGLNSLVWIAWFTWRVGDDGKWWSAALTGAIVINLPIPAEIVLFLRLTGGDAPADWHSTWLHAAVVSLAILLVIVTASQMARRRAGTRQVKGRLWRGGIRDLEAVSAITAEDHYCRVALSSGGSRLLLGRFSDVVAELADVDGVIARRGCWVAAAAVDAIERRGRAWTIVLRNGTEVRVAGQNVAALKARGWISSAGAAGTVN